VIFIATGTGRGADGDCGPQFVEDIARRIGPESTAVDVEPDRIRVASFGKLSKIPSSRRSVSAHQRERATELNYGRVLLPVFPSRRNCFYNGIFVGADAGQCAGLCRPARSIYHATVAKSMIPVIMEGRVLW